MKSLTGNIGKYLHSIRVSKYFYKMQQVQKCKGHNRKNIKLDFIEIKIFYLPKETTD